MNPCTPMTGTTDAAPTGRQELSLYCLPVLQVSVYGCGCVHGCVGVYVCMGVFMDLGVFVGLGVWVCSWV